MIEYNYKDSSSKKNLRTDFGWAYQRGELTSGKMYKDIACLTAELCATLTFGWLESADPSNEKFSVIGLAPSATLENNFIY